MPRAPHPLSVTFVALLSAYTLACSGTCGDQAHSATTDAAALDALDDGDGVISDAECWELCLQEVPEEIDTSEPDSGPDSGWRSEPRRSACEVVPDGERYTVTCTSTAWCEGVRGHACVSPPPAARDGDPLGAWLAEMAHNERASVVAFRVLGLELRRFGAPEALLARVDAAADDERRHGRTMARLARARGAHVPRPRRRPFSARSLLAFAIENVVEGCVRETWGTLEAHHQARFATWPALRRAMARIAEDETQHAELAFDLHRWAMSRLNPGERAQVEQAGVGAIAGLRARFGQDPAPVLLGEAGLFDARRGSELVGALVATGLLDAA